MPNWCENELRISGDEEAMKAVHAALNTTTDETPRLSFQALLPIPEHEKDNWYEWSMQNWGTKWDIAEDGKGILPLDESQAYLEYNFSTAWSPPIELLKNITDKFPGVTFQVAYAEPGVCFAGLYQILDGKVLTDEQHTTMADVNAFGEDFFGSTYYDEDELEEEE